MIVGCDIDENCRRLSYDDPRILVVVQDANTGGAINKIRSLSESFNVILDDGSHHSADIIASFLNYFPILTSNGIYVVEDLHASYWDHYGGGLGRSDSAIEFFKHLADIVNFEHWGISGNRKLVFEEFHSFGIADFPDEVLASIHSISFLNSICVIRKKIESKNELGRRLIHGEESPVTIDRKAWSGLKGVAPEQVASSYMLKNKEQALLIKANAELERRINSIENSHIWRLTKPYRNLKSRLRQVMRKHQKVS
jgi:hypothetical protein